jgi:hypothetical protein
MNFLIKTFSHPGEQVEKHRVEKAFANYVSYETRVQISSGYGI